MATSSRHRQYREALDSGNFVNGSDIAEMLGQRRSNSRNATQMIERNNAAFAADSGYEVELTYREFFAASRPQKWYMVPRDQAEAFVAWYEKRRHKLVDEGWTDEWRETVNRGYALVLANIQERMEARGVPGTAAEALALVKITGPNFPRVESPYIADGDYRYEP